MTAVHQPNRKGTRIVAQNMSAQTARAYWFFLFHQVPDLPEALIAGRQAEWLSYFFSDWCYHPHAISGDAFDTYVRAYRRPGAQCTARRFPAGMGRLSRRARRLYASDTRGRVPPHRRHASL